MRKNVLKGISNLILPLVAVVICSVVSGCGKSEKSGERETQAAAKYTSINVTDGGVIAGTVTIRGAIPTVPDLELNHDNNYCGISMRSPRLLCDANGGISNAVVYLVKIMKGKSMEPSAQPLVIDQLHCMYTPHVLAAPIGSSVAIRNSDNILHSVHIYSGDKSIWNEAQPISGQTNIFVLNTPGIMRLQCDAGHIWMSGYIFAAENPYYVVTDSNGKFSITGVPPGEYTIACWHEGWNATKVKNESGALLAYSYDEPYELNQSVAVTARDTTQVTFAIVPHEH